MKNRFLSHFLSFSLLLTSVTACNLIEGDKSPTEITMTFGNSNVNVLSGRFSMRVDKIDAEATEAQEIAINVQCELDGEEIDENFIAGPITPDVMHCDTYFQVVEININNGDARSVRLRLKWDDGEE